MSLCGKACAVPRASFTPTCGGEVDALVVEKQIALAHEGGDDGRRRRDAKRVDDRRLYLKEVGELLLEVEVHVERAVEATRAASAAAILVERGLGRVERVLGRGPS